MSTLGLLAACHEQQGLLATALREFRATEKRAAAANDARAAFAGQRAAALEATVPLELTIRLGTSSVPRHPEVLQGDGAAVPPESLALEIAVDPGAHEIIVRAPQHQEWRTTLTLKPGDRLIAGVPPLAPLAPRPRRRPRPSSRSRPSPRLPRPDARIAAFVAGGLGVVGIVVSGPRSRRPGEPCRTTTSANAVHATCQSAASCAPGRASRDSAFQLATGSTVAFVAGGAGVLTGVVLLAIRPTPSPRPPRGIGLAPFAGRDGGGAVLSGRF